MRTAIFNKFTDLPEEFREDLETLWTLTDEQRGALMAGALEILWAETTGDSKLITDRTVMSVPGNRADLLRSLKVLRFICRQWNPFRDTADDFIADLKDLALIPVDKEAEAVPFLQNLLAALEQDNLRRTKRMYANSLLPSYVGTTTLVDIRPFFDHPFGSGLDDQIDDYSPNCLGWVPVILVHITRDAGQTTTFEFQCDEREVQRMIETLQAALRDLEEAKRHLSVQGDEE